MGAQWLSGRVLDSRPKGPGFEYHRRHCVVSLSKNINPSLVLVQPRKTCPFIIERLLMGRKESNQIKSKPAKGKWSMARKYHNQTIASWGRDAEHQAYRGVFILHGLSRWRQGCPRNAPVSPRRRPGGDTVVPESSQFTTLFDSLPGYSRCVPVVLNILKQPEIWAGSTRYIPDRQGCPRCRHDCDTVHHGSSRIIKPGWTGTFNRDSENGALLAKSSP